MTTMTCPSCGCGIPSTTIPDNVLLSERGRRNSSRRKVFKGRPKGQPLVWRSHLPGAARCWCGRCRLAELDRVEAVLVKRAAIGAKPWVQEELDRLRKSRAAIERVVRERAGNEQPTSIAA